MRRFALILARVLALVLAAWPALATTQDRPLNTPLRDEAAIRAALEGRRLIYDGGAFQEFRASGRTLYHAGRDSWGYWRVQAGQYCSQWPPSDLWACYDVEAIEGGVRFRDAGGTATDGVYAR